MVLLISVLVLLVLLVLVLVLIFILLILLILVLLTLLVLLMRFSALAEIQLLEHLVYFCCTFEPRNLGNEAEGRGSSG